MRKHINTFKKFNENYTYSRINNDLVKIGDKVSYEKDMGGFDIKQGHEITNKTLEIGIVIGKIPSISNLSPKFVIENENGNVDEVMVGDVIKIL